MDDKAICDMRTYVWGYFALHSDQRLKTFNFYLVLVTIVLAVALASLKDAKYPVYASPACILLTVLSFVFWKLDCRNRELIKHAEAILKSIEKHIPASAVPEELRLFTQEEMLTDATRAQRGRITWRPRSWFIAHYSYYDCFVVVFVLLGCMGAVLTAASPFFPGTSQQQRFHACSCNIADKAP